jgi:hypothetical protein
MERYSLAPLTDYIPEKEAKSVYLLHRSSEPNP